MAIEELTEEAIEPEETEERIRRIENSEEFSKEEKREIKRIILFSQIKTYFIENPDGTVSRLMLPSDSEYKLDLIRECQHEENNR